MIAKSSLIFFILVCLPLLMTPQSIADFSYTEYKVQEVPTNKNNIHLHP
jgi:hypothetical protein